MWHVPLLIVLGVTPNGYSLLEMAGHSLFIDSFFLLSGRNLLSAMIYHLSAMIYHQGVNIGFLFFVPKTQTLPGLFLLLAVALLVRVHAERTHPPG